MSDRPTILIVHRHLAGLAPALADAFEALPVWEEAGRARLGDARAIVVAGEFALDPALIEAMPKIGLIACFSVGYDGIDAAAMRARGIAVSHARSVNAEDTADHAIGLMIGHRRAIVSGDRLLREGGWTTGQKTISASLGGATLGIVGLGEIGAAVARRGEAMRMQVRWWGPRDKPDVPWPRAESLEALARDSDVLVVTARAHEGNRGMISAAVIAALGPQGLLVNVARGQLVDEDALIAALRDGRLGGAALDVFAEEPTAAARWDGVPNTVLTPHTAGATDTAVAGMVTQLRANLDAFFAGRPVVTPAA